MSGGAPAAARGDVRIRPRRVDDVPALCEVLAGQQARSSYPLRWPLPFPVADFIVRPHELGAWVAERAGAVVGHVSVQRVSAGAGLGGYVDRGPDPLWCAALDCPVDRLGAVSSLFVGLDARGTGVGRALLAQAVARIRELGLEPCLDVQARSRQVRAVYAHLGWEEVGTFRPGWLPDDEDDEIALVLRDNGIQGSPAS